MYTAQRVIKYCAVAFAVLLICGIISAIVTAGMMLSYVLGGWDNAPISETVEVIDVSDIAVQEVKSLHLDLKATSVVIERGEELSVEADEEVITVSQGEKALYIQEKDFHFLTDWGTRGKEMKITIPHDWTELETLRLNAGAGRVEIRDLTVKNLELDLGAGKTEISSLVVTERAKVKGGAGYLAVRESEIKDLDLDMGVGKVEIGAKLTGNNQIDAGVGKLDLNLRGTSEDYRIKVEKGLGSITLNGKKMADDETWGDGKTTIDIDGGVGAIEIMTE